GPGAALTVPGAVDGWCRTHERFGGLSLADCLARAIEYARDGSPSAQAWPGTPPTTPIC
ncbi:hypothetical protein GS461_07095, partial [Rhodococcus hoagii]|nr:hypothetical protein [Prescottella equi]